MEATGGPGDRNRVAPVSVSPPAGARSDAVAFSPRGTFLAMGGNDGQAYLFDTATFNTSELNTPDNSGITSVAFSPSGALLAPARWTA